MSKFTDFYPAATGVGFPFTGSAGMTGSLDTDVLGVEGGVAFSYNNVGVAAGWTSAGAGTALNTIRKTAGFGRTVNAVTVAGGTAFSGGVLTETWDGSSWNSNSPTSDLNISRGNAAAGGTYNDG